MKFFYSIGIFLLCLNSLTAQRDIEGLWEGTITFGGIHSEDTYKFQLYLQTQGKKITGKSLIYLTETETIEMDVSGSMYGDRSVYLEEFNFIPVAGYKNEEMAEEASPFPFYRKYQFLHNRSIWESKLEGYWQEIINEPFDPYRERGRITLKRVEKRAKP